MNEKILISHGVAMSRGFSTCTGQGRAYMIIFISSYNIIFIIVIMTTGNAIQKEKYSSIWSVEMVGPRDGLLIFHLLTRIFLLPSISKKKWH